MVALALSAVDGVNSSTSCVGMTMYGKRDPFVQTDVLLQVCIPFIINVSQLYFVIVFMLDCIMCS